VTNSFYAVPACLDLSVVGAIIGKKTTTPSSSSGGGAVSLLGPNSVPSPSVHIKKNISATKLIAFAQSSQVHPVITLEVTSSVDRPVPASSEVASSSFSLDLSRVLRPITSLVILASGRECAALEVASIPDSRALAMHGKAGSVGTGAGAGMIGLVSTMVKSAPPRHGITSLASPILAAAPLSPRTRFGRGVENGIVSRTKIITGDLSAGPLVALLTADGLIHIRSPFCIAVPLTSIEVGTRPNDFFSLSALPCPSKSVRTRSILATSYGGEARLVSCQAESSQDFADRLIKLSIDAFGIKWVSSPRTRGSIGSHVFGNILFWSRAYSTQAITSTTILRMRARSFRRSTNIYGQRSFFCGIGRSTRWWIRSYGLD